MPSNKYSVIIPRFDGGLNSRVSPLLGDISQSPNLQNVEFDEFGAVGTINGVTALGAAIASARVDGLWSFMIPTATHLVAACNNMILRASGNTFVTIPSAQDIFTAAVKIHAEQMNQYFFVSNGYATPHKWNGTEFTRWGIPVNSMPVSANTNGTTTYMVSGGYYQYVFYGISSGGSRGDYSTANTDMQNVNGVAITVKGIPTAPISHGINYIGIARCTAGLSGLFWVVTQIANGQTTYTDTASDSALSTEAPEDNGLPAAFTVFAPFLGRMFGACSTGSNPEYLYYSEVNEPEVFPAENILRVGPGDGCEIRSIGLLQNGIVIGKDDGQGNGSMWYLSMPTSSAADWVLKKLTTPYGSIGPKRLPNFGNMLAYLNKYGIYDLNEAESDLFRSDSIGFDIQTDIDAFGDAYLEGAYAVNFKNKLWISVPYGSGTANDRIYTYDYVKGRGLVSRKEAAWSRIPDIDINTMCVHQGTLYGGSSLNDGLVYQLDTGHDFNGSAIDSYFYTMVIKGQKGHERHTKQWRYALVTVDASGAWNMSVDYQIFDTNDTLQSAAIDLTPGGAVWNTMVWGTAKWGRPRDQIVVRITFNDAVGVYLQLRFRTATADQYFKVHNVEVFYNLKGVR